MEMTMTSQVLPANSKVRCVDGRAVKREGICTRKLMKCENLLKLDL